MVATRLASVAIDLGDNDFAIRLRDDAKTALHRLPDAGDLLHQVEQLNSRLHPPSTAYKTLTPAERRVLDYLATHHTLGEIGKLLYISRSTVKTHVSSIYSKLGVTKRDAAVTHLPATREDR
jgi:DNA-binding CsgD family transcriptional regulator